MIFGALASHTTDLGYEGFEYYYAISSVSLFCLGCAIERSPYPYRACVHYLSALVHHHGSVIRQIGNLRQDFLYGFRFSFAAAFYAAANHLINKTAFLFGVTHRVVPFSARELWDGQNPTPPLTRRRLARMVRYRVPLQPCRAGVSSHSAYSAQAQCEQIRELL